MKFSQMKWALWGLGVLVLAACSSDNNGFLPTAPGSTMSITSTGATGTKTYVAKITNASMQGFANQDMGQTTVQMCGDIDKDNDCSQMIMMTVDGTAAGPYAIGTGQTQLVYHDEPNEYASTGGTINVTSIGGAGSPVVGTFDVTLECSSGCTGTVPATGKFNVILH